MKTVLVTDAQQRKALSAARALGRAGYRVVAAEVTRFATARFSRYVHAGLVSPDPEGSPGHYRDWLLRVVAEHRIDCVLPMDDATTAIVAAMGSELPAAAMVPFPQQFRTGRDKAATVALAQEAHIRTPNSTLDLPAAQQGTLGWPVVVKARRSSGARGLFLAGNQEELRQAYRTAQGQDPEPLLQEFIPPGRKYDVCLLYSRSGDQIAGFVQEELRGYPLWGGPSTLQESVLRPDLIDLAKRLLAPVGWRGPVEVEFLEDPRTGAPVLMEINPRFWASLDLAVRCGFNFPVWTVELALGLIPAIPAAYESGRRCRWLLPGDILHFLANPRRWQMEPGFFRTLDSRTHDDILSWDDPLPAAGFFLAALRYFLDLRMWRMIIR